MKNFNKTYEVLTFLTDGSFFISASEGKRTVRYFAIIKRNVNKIFRIHTENNVACFDLWFWSILIY